ncbi:MAG: hypothetical protein AABX93_03545 [Nanoarchaeota archaeon]
MDEEIKEKIFQQAIDMWLSPEIERRKKFGKIADNFVLSKAQIVFSLDTGGNKIRLNDEVKAIIKCKINKPIKKDDVVHEIDVDKIEKIELTDDDSNCAHITLLFFRGNWIVSFDFRYNKEIIREHIGASKEFYDSAMDDLAKNRLRSFYENAFNSAELSAKSILLMLPDKKILEGRNHRERISKFDNWAKMGNAKIEFSDTLSNLSLLRDSARYLHSDDFKRENPNKVAQTLREMINFAEGSIQ